jgi:hypothetical protein
MDGQFLYVTVVTAETATNVWLERMGKARQKSASPGQGATGRPGGKIELRL